MLRFGTGMMRAAAAKIMEASLNAVYALSCRHPRSDVVLFLSRQSDSLSDDFRLIALEFEKLGSWDREFRVRMLRGGVLNKLSYAFSLLGDAKALARCRICFVEGYNPAVSMLKMKAEELKGDSINRIAPVEPLVVQIWHASGAFKKFGYQVLDSPYGRSAELARLYHMHRNYSWIVVSGVGAIRGFAEALGYPESRVVALGRASFDCLHATDETTRERVLNAYPRLRETHKPIIVFAPTIDRSGAKTPFSTLRNALEYDARSNDYEFLWSDHPVVGEEAGRPADITTRDMLEVADLLVTDYSSMVFDAQVLDVPFAFYVPLLEKYLISPGLMINPKALCPDLCLTSPDDLLAFLHSILSGHELTEKYPQAQRKRFIGDMLTACDPGAAERITRFSINQVYREFKSKRNETGD